MNGHEIYNINTFWNDIFLGNLKKDDTICVTFSQKMFLNNGIYLITLALSHSDATQFYDWHDNIIKFNVRNDKKSRGVVDLKSKIKTSII